MRLALDPITIEIGGESFTLSPSLRAATRIAQKHQDFQKALAGILDGNLTVITDLIADGSNSTAAVPALLKEIGLSGLRKVLTRLVAPLTDFVLAIVGHDPDAPETPEPTGEQMPLADYHKRLFEIATVGFGWTPQEAWAATRAEIITAYHAHEAMHRTADERPKSTAYTPEKLAEIEAAGLDPEFDRAGLRALKARLRAGQ